MKKFLYVFTNIVFKIFFRVEIFNPERLPVDGPVILCAEHRTMTDMFFLGFKLKRWVYWMAKEELFRNPVLGFIYRKLGAFPVKRGTGDIGSIKTAYKLLQEGKVVGIFPHGTRVKAANKGTVRAKSGAAMLAANSGAMIVPAAIIGNYRLFSKMKIIYGEPYKIEVEGDEKLSNEELAAFSEDLMKRINSLLEDKT